MLCSLTIPEEKELAINQGTMSKYRGSALCKTSTHTQGTLHKEMAKENPTQRPTQVMCIIREEKTCIYI